MTRMRALSHSTYRSPVGVLHIGATQHGICSITWNSEKWQQYIKKTVQSSDIEISDDELPFEQIKTELEHYFQGSLRKFTTPVDLFNLTHFENKVLHTTQQIGYGSVLSYQEIGVRIGSAQSSRAVGNALGKNPVPIIVPCHRVIKTDGTLGGFGGGLNVKEYLLHLEQQ